MLYRFTSHHFNSREFILIVDGKQYQQTLSTYVRMLGYEPIPINISDSSMGAAKGVMRVVRGLKGGKSTLIAPDGPKGPAREPKAGIVAIARRAAALILPIALHTDLAIREKRWDGKYHPFPLARIQMRIGDPIDPHDHPDQTELLSFVRNALNETSDAVQPDWPRDWDIEPI
jgi:lysophospholipid acyltransferase (LPLAT)-like uncharacterized protein